MTSKTATSRSPESFNGTPVRLETVDRFVFEGLQQKFLDTFNCPTVWTTATDKTKSLDLLFARNKKTVSYPYAFLILNSWEVSEQRMNLRESTLRGTRVSISDDKKSTLEMRFLPVDFNVAVDFRTNSYLHLKDFARRWLISSRMGRLNFNIDFGETTFGVKVVPEASVNFPQREASPDNVQEYEASLNLIIQGYISESEVVEQQVIDTVQMDMGVNNTETQNNFWSFDIKRRELKS